MNCPSTWCAWATAWRRVRTWRTGRWTRSRSSVPRTNQIGENFNEHRSPDDFKEEFLAELLNPNRDCFNPFWQDGRGLTAEAAAEIV